MSPPALTAVRLLAALLTLSSPAYPQQPREDERPPEAWSIEVILFAHRPGEIAWREVTGITDYRQWPAMPALLVGAGEQASPPANDSLFATSGMQDAWRKLGADYERFAYYRWTQPHGIGRRWRLHDGSPLPLPRDLLPAVLEVTDPAKRHYRLDGSIKINTGAVGVVDIRISQRTPVWYYRRGEPDGRQPDMPPAAGSFDELPETGTAEKRWRVRRLRQNRRIEAGRMEYFDSSGLAVLLLMEPIKTGADGNEQPETAALSQ